MDAIGMYIGKALKPASLVIKAYDSVNLLFKSVPPAPTSEMAGQLPGQTALSGLKKRSQKLEARPLKILKFLVLSGRKRK